MFSEVHSGQCVQYNLGKTNDMEQNHEPYDYSLCVCGGKKT